MLAEGLSGLWLIAAPPADVGRFLPLVAGALLGVIALWFPHIIGVGYETTSRALTGSLVLNEVIVFAVLKVAAVSITLGGRMGGGVFSPSLMIGALSGLAFGLIATSVFPDVSGSVSLSFGTAISRVDRVRCQ